MNELVQRAAKEGYQDLLSRLRGALVESMEVLREDALIIPMRQYIQLWIAEDYFGSGFGHELLRLLKEEDLRVSQTFKQKSLILKVGL